MSFPFIASSSSSSRQRTTRPITTGTSVLGIVYDNGVLLAADTLLSYGTMAKVQNVSRLHVVDNAHCIIGASGEYSDYQAILDLLQQKALEERTSIMNDSLYYDNNNNNNDSSIMTASQIWNYLRFVMYSKRNQFNPYWNDVIVAGMDSTTGEPFLGMIDKIGTTVKESFLATGYGAYLAIPLLREKWHPNMSEGEARALLEDCMKILFYRDCRASSRIQLAKAERGQRQQPEQPEGEVSSSTVTTKPTFIVSDPYDLDLSGGWDAPSFIAPKADMDDDGW